MEEIKIEGYWYSEDEPQYPMPEPGVLSEKEAGQIFFLIRIRQMAAKEKSYKGWSTSRITGEHLGASEFEADGWRWPCDFAQHYVLIHRVKPSPEFLEFIGYK